MMDVKNLSVRELEERRSQLEKRYRDFSSRGLSLDLTRGKPCPEQLDLSREMLDCVKDADYLSSDGLDCRNYGGLDGLPEAKELFSQYLEVGPDEIIIGGNSSLCMMHDTIMSAMILGVVESDIPWGKLSNMKFLCPSPGYDRHFSLCEYLNIEMLPVELKEDGPDMDVVESLVAVEETIKGIWCVPKYSNPSGITYSDAVVDRLARMKTKARDFRIFWDNAYAVHHLTDTPPRLKNILSACKQAGNPDRVFIFGSTSKITFAGAGVAMMAGSTKNMEFRKKQMSFQTIGPDKLQQLRHIRFLKDMEGIERHMKKHAAILQPKFDAVLTILEKELNGKNIAQWSKPDGGYFVSLDTLDGCAKSVVAMAAQAGVALTPAGATYPYRRDPRDRNIRIAPTFPPIEDLALAMELVSICIQLVSIDKITQQK
jgi:DNA-binding transcriptional MocR family regulator